MIPRRHGTQRRTTDRGFSLVEMLIAMSVVTVLAAIAIPQYRGVRERGYLSTMRSDLRNLAVIEESHFYDTSTYTADLSTLEAKGFRRSPATLVQVHEATAIGWSASISHAATLRQCFVFVGAAAPVGSATEDGRMDCG
ncbi:MAG: prepilin-type N-terminal cleavage/methylation domain-containing protein [Gemmatimonadota bacterium]|nr:prepilin-type N-terminal cleavage/methylation domain-containing protein [Gemmatimonadota bacterium]